MCHVGGVHVGGCGKLAGCHIWASNVNGVNSDESGVVWYKAGRSNVCEYSTNRIWCHIVEVGINESGCGWENEGSIDGKG